MTREERHIAVLSRLLENMDVYDSIQPTTERKKAIKAAIQALSQEPTEKSMCDRNICISNEYNGIGCDECIVNKAEQEPCDDAISRKDIQDYIAKYLSQYLYEDVRQAVEVIDAYIGDMPSVTQKYGKWILLDECANSGYYCSNCQKKLVKEGWSQTVKKIKYCPNCGAKMVEPQESEDKE